MTDRARSPTDPSLEQTYRAKVTDRSGPADDPSLERAGGRPQLPSPSSLQFVSRETPILGAAHA